MTLTIEQALTTPGIQTDMCLAEQSKLKGFSWDALKDPAEAVKQRLAPALALAMHTAAKNLAANIWVERPGDSPNKGNFGVNLPVPAGGVVLHWWGNPVGQRHDGIVAWLCNPASGVSAHYVVSPGRATQIVPLNTPSWANGHTWANCNRITIEADPNNIPGTIATIVELLAQLVDQNALTNNFELSGHRDWYSTACPGSYYPRLAEIRQAVYEGGEMQLSDVVTRADGHRGTVNDVLGYIDQRVEQMYRWFGEWAGNGMLDAQVERHGLPETDPRHNHKVSVKEIFAWSDTHFTALLEGQKALLDGQKALLESITQLKDPEAAARVGEAANRVGDALNIVKETANA